MWACCGAAARRTSIIHHHLTISDSSLSLVNHLIGGQKIACSLIPLRRLLSVSSLTPAAAAGQAKTFLAAGADYWSQMTAKFGEHVVHAHCDVAYALSEQRMSAAWLEENQESGLRFGADAMSRLREPAIRGEAYAFAQRLYNHGVRLYQSQHAAQAVQWLALSSAAMNLVAPQATDMAFSRKCAHKSARTFLVTALCYKTLRQYDESLAHWERSVSALSPDGDTSAVTADQLFLHAQLMSLLARPVAEQEESLMRVLRHNECTANMGVALCIEASERNVSE